MFFCFSTNRSVLINALLWSCLSVSAEVVEYCVEVSDAGTCVNQVFEFKTSTVLEFKGNDERSERPVGLDRHDHNNTEARKKPSISSSRSSSNAQSDKFFESLRDFANESYARKIGFGDLDSSIGITNKMTAFGAPIVFAVSSLQLVRVQNEISERLKDLLPEIEKALTTKNGSCALVTITVDSHPSDSGKIYDLREVRFEGVGDTAIKTMAPKAYRLSKHGSWDKAPAEGYLYDEEASAVMCFGLDDGEISYSRVDMSIFRTGVDKIVSEMKVDELEKSRKAAEAQRKILEEKRKKEERKKQLMEFRALRLEAPNL